MMTVNAYEVFIEVMEEKAAAAIKELCELTGKKPEDYRELSPLDLRDTLWEERAKHEVKEL